MKINIDYKNRFKLILDIIFRPTNVNRTLSVKESKIVSRIESETKDKISFIMYDKENAIIESIFNSDVILFAAPMNSMKDLDYGSSTYQEKRLDIKTISYSLQDGNCSLDYLKEVAARQLSKDIVKREMIKTRRSGSYIEFYINIV